jgi:hypothetical protein
LSKLLAPFIIKVLNLNKQSSKQMLFRDLKSKSLRLGFLCSDTAGSKRVKWVLKMAGTEMFKVDINTRSSAGICHFKETFTFYESSQIKARTPQNNFCKLYSLVHSV